MNIDNIKSTIEFLKTTSSYYDHTEYSYPDDTPSNLAGYAAVDAGYRLDHHSDMCSDSEGNEYDIEKVAIAWFDLEGGPSGLGFELFCGIEEKFDSFITREDSIAVLENLIKTGEVDWKFVEDKYGETIKNREEEDEQDRKNFSNVMKIIMAREMMNAR